MSLCTNSLAPILSGIGIGTVSLCSFPSSLKSNTKSRFWSSYVEQSNTSTILSQFSARKFTFFIKLPLLNVKQTFRKLFCLITKAIDRERSFFQPKIWKIGRHIGRYLTKSIISEENWWLANLWAHKHSWQLTFKNSRWRKGNNMFTVRVQIISLILLAI